MTRTRERWGLAALTLLACIMLCGCAGNQGQRADLDFVASRETATSAGKGPVVTIDEGHSNFHTRTGRYAGFAAELEATGYSVVSLETRFEPGALSEVSILVIANALHPSSQEEWISPTPSAFDPAEIEVLGKWVRGGGRLLLIADHMPFPGAAADLAKSMGFAFKNGFLFQEDSESGTFFLDVAGGLLNTEALGEFAAPELEEGQVKVFTGQAFGLLAPDAKTVLHAPEESRLLMPEVAWEFHEETPSLPTHGLAIGAIRELGRGRLAVFGEAAMFTAQVVEREGRTIRVGMSDPEASGNATLLRSTMAWLSADLPANGPDGGLEE